MSKRAEEAQARILESMVREQELKEDKARSEAKIAEIKLDRLLLALKPPNVTFEPVSITLPAGTDAGAVGRAVKEWIEKYTPSEEA